MNIKTLIRDIPDFPKPGILFKDISPLLGNAEALQYTADQLVKLVPNDQKIDKVIGIESRGFILGPMLAERLQAGFVPVRKKGKLPYQVTSRKYGLEYGEDEIEIHTDAFQSGDRILIHDDIIATGGTANAVVDLVKELGGIVVQCNFLIELSFLEGRSQIDARVASLIQFD